jgi:O-antigen/teichoic acid export membrane protein
MRQAHLLARDTLWNLLGQGLPLVAAFFAIPVLTHQLGPARFGILTLGWIVLGYFSLFDLGLGRALTQAVAARLGGRGGDEGEVPAVIWTSVAAMSALGVVGMVVTLAVSPVMVRRVLNVPTELQHETLQAFAVMAISIPIVILTAGFRGLLEARRRFDLANAVRAPLNALMVAGPLAVLPWTNSLAVVFGVLLLIRLLAMVIHAWLAASLFPGVLARPRIEPRLIRPLFQLGGWMTVSNVVAPLLVYVDRFVIGAVSSMSAVGFYTAPYEAVTKMWLLPVALGGVLFPEFAGTFRADPTRGARVYRRALVTILMVILPPVVIVTTFAHLGLRLWLGATYAAESTGVVQWLAAGILYNSLATIAFTLVQGIGRPDLTAKLHTAELVPYLALLWVLTERYGIAGAAAAWFVRCTVDAGALLLMVRSILPPRHAPVWPVTVAGLAAGVLLLVSASVASLPTRLFIVCVVMPVFVVVGFATLLDREDVLILKAAMRGRLGVLLGGSRPVRSD